MDNGSKISVDFNEDPMRGFSKSISSDCELDCWTIGELCVGGYRISYVNPYLEVGRVAFDEIWDNPLDCINVMSHRVDRCIGCGISKEQYDELNEKFRILDKADKI